MAILTMIEKIVKFDYFLPRRLKEPVALSISSPSKGEGVLNLINKSG